MSANGEIADPVAEVTAFKAMLEAKMAELRQASEEAKALQMKHNEQFETLEARTKTLEEAVKRLVQGYPPSVSAERKLEEGVAKREPGMFEDRFWGNGDISLLTTHGMC